MGQEQSHPLVSQNAPGYYRPHYQTVQSFNHGNYGPVKVVLDSDTHTTMLLKETNFQQSHELDSELKFLNYRTTYNHPNLPIIYGYNTSNSAHLCSTFHVLNVFIEALSDDLQTQIINRSHNNLPYTDEEILFAGENMISALHFLQSQNDGASHGDIRPLNIYLTDKEFKLSDPKLEYQKNANYLIKAVVHHEAAYLSPALIHQGKFGSLDIVEDPHKSDIFALGATLLAMATLRESEPLFDYQNGRINDKELNDRLVILRSRYPRFTSELIEDMLQLDEKRRPDVIQLATRIAPYQRSIRERVNAQKIKVGPNGARSAVPGQANMGGYNGMGSKYGGPGQQTAQSNTAFGKNYNNDWGKDAHHYNNLRVNEQVLKSNFPPAQDSAIGGTPAGWNDKGHLAAKVNSSNALYWDSLPPHERDHAKEQAKRAGPSSLDNKRPDALGQSQFKVHKDLDDIDARIRDALHKSDQNYNKVYGNQGGVLPQREYEFNNQGYQGRTPLNNQELTINYYPGQQQQPHYNQQNPGQKQNFIVGNQQTPTNNYYINREPYDVNSAQKGAFFYNAPPRNDNVQALKNIAYSDPYRNDQQGQYGGYNQHGGGQGAGNNQYGGQSNYNQYGARDNEYSNYNQYAGQNAGYERGQSWNDYHDDKRPAPVFYSNNMSQQRESYGNNSQKEAEDYYAQLRKPQQNQNYGNQDYGNQGNQNYGNYVNTSNPNKNQYDYGTQGAQNYGNRGYEAQDVNKGLVKQSYPNQGNQNYGSNSPPSRNQYDYGNQGNQNYNHNYNRQESRNSYDSGSKKSVKWQDQGGKKSPDQFHF